MLSQGFRRNDFIKEPGAAWRLLPWILLGWLAPAGFAAAAPPGGELFSPPAIAFERLDAENLLPQSSVYDLSERADGYLWLVTLDGLVRYDGIRQKVYDRAAFPELETTRLTALLDDPASGTLYLGAEDGRLMLFRGDRFTTFGPSAARLGPIIAVRKGAGGHLFLFHHLGAEEVVLGRDGVPIAAGPVVRGLSNYACGAAILGADGQLWQADQGGFFPLPLPPELGPAPERKQCQNDTAGGVWLRGTAGALFRARGQTLERDPRGPLLPPDAIPFAEDGAGNLWLKLADAPRLGRLDREGRIRRYGEKEGVDPTGDVIRAYFDREGGFWIGTTTALYRYLGEAIRGLSLRHPGGEVAVATHYEARDGTTYVATRDQRFWRLGRGGELEELTTVDAAGRLVVRPDLLDPPPPAGAAILAPANYQDYAESGGALWVGLDSGVLRLAGGRITYVPSLRPFSGPALRGGVNDLLAEGDTLWVGTTEAVVRLENGRVARVYAAEDGIATSVLILSRDRHGVLWAGTRAGVLRLEGEKFVQVEGLGPELGQSRALHFDDRDRLWVGTYDRGLYRRLPDGRVQHAAPQDAYPASGAFTIKFDDRGFLWTTSNRGLLRVKVAEVEKLLEAGHGRIAGALYGRTAGLPSSECNGGFGASGYVCEGGAAWCVQTLGGIAVAHLGEVPVVDLAPVPVIEEAWVDGQARPLDGGRLRLAPQDRNVLLRFAGIAFDGANQVALRYWLSGYDQGWVDTGGRREALFGDLPPGEYGLELVAESRDGLVSEKPARLAILVAPAWWERGSVRALGLLGAAGLVWAGVRLRLRFLSRRHARRERELRAAAEELELRVRERTTELDAEVAERRRAEAEARSASAAKSAFLAQMSHELRTPLNAIIGLSEMLARTPLAPHQREWVATVCSSGEALMSIIEDILDFSRIEAGRLELESRDFDPAAVVAEAMSIVGPLAAAKDLLIGWRSEGEVPARVAGDAPRLRQVLLNLLGNAIKFTPRGSVAVTLSVTPRGEDWLLELAVADTGIGIAPEAQARIFEPFTQADASMSRRFGGSGLGLAICQRVIAALGGRLLLESRPGAGSTFTIEIPVGRGDDDRRSAAGSGEFPLPAPPAAPEGADFSRLRVLVAEDDQVNQLVSRSLLQAVGVAVRVAGSGEEALELLATAEEPYHLVLMDLHLPGWSGLETSRRLRAELPAERQPFLVALTAAVTPEDRAACRAAGMDDFLGKPIRESDLRAVLQRTAALGRKA